MTDVSTVCRQCRVVRLERFGVFVEIAPGKDGLVHQSELDLKSVRNVADQFAEGDLLDVMLLEVQDTGKLSLSRWEAARPQNRSKINNIYIIHPERTLANSHHLPLKDTIMHDSKSKQPVKEQLCRMGMHIPTLGGRRLRAPCLSTDSYPEMLTL